jgi:hypothetical protein
MTRDVSRLPGREVALRGADAHVNPPGPEAAAVAPPRSGKDGVADTECEGKQAETTAQQRLG